MGAEPAMLQEEIVAKEIPSLWDIQKGLDKCGTEDDDSLSGRNSGCGKVTAYKSNSIMCVLPGCGQSTACRRARAERIRSWQICRNKNRRGDQSSR